MKRSYRADIDGLRGVAVLSVLGFHSGVSWMPGGFIGVDVFFVISGFLISSILFEQLSGNRFSLLQFYRRRVRRIFPALIIVLAATWIYGWFALLPEEFRQLARHIAAGAGFASNLLVANGAGYFDQTASTKPLLHLWSLGIEEQYYLVWPCIVALLWKARSAMRLAVIAILAIASFCMNALTVHSMPVAAYYMPHTRFWELLIGGGLAYYQMCGSLNSEASPSWIKSLSSFIGFTMVVYAVGKFDSGTVFPGFAALLPTLGTALVIFAGPSTWLNRVFLSSKALVSIGLVSYPLYLWHWPILSVLSISEIHSASARAGAIFASIILAAGTYQVIEKPIRKQTISRIFGFSMVPALLTLLILVASIGMYTVVGRGLPHRLPPEVQALMSYNEDEHLSGWRAGKCFLESEQDSTKFSPECVDPEPSNAPLVLLWGDSHAADLYPGIRYLQKTSSFRLAQFNSSACPPVANLDQPKRAFCRSINDYVLSRIAELKPDMVIMAAQFELYGRTITVENVAATVASLKRAGVREVLVVGPNPEWHPSEPRLVLLKTQRGVGHKVPERLEEPLRSRSFQTDLALRRIAPTSGTFYLSPIDLLCDKSGCLTKVTESETVELLSFDSNHLTTVGSRFVVKELLGSHFRLYHR